MIAWRGRRISWGTRYALVIRVTAALALGCWAMVAARPIFEPSVRAIHAVLRVGWPARGHYEPTDYYLYAAFPGALSAAGLLATIWAMALHRRTDPRWTRFWRAVAGNANPPFAEPRNFRFSNRAWGSSSVS
jgi:hypothetical protein